MLSIVCTADSENGGENVVETGCAVTTPKRRSIKRAKPACKKSKPRRRAKTTPEIAWIKELICPFVYGERTPDGIYPNITKQAFIGLWNIGLAFPSLPNYKLMDHFQGDQTLYFFGRGGIKQNRMLVMIDIDVLKHNQLGSTEGAKQFADHLKQMWPELYFEKSTNGQGLHGYFVLLKTKCDAERTNDALKRLEKWLRAEAKRINADIEQVEIKGTCLDIVLDGRLIQSVQYASFGKIPRDVSRFEEWQNTTRLRVRDLESSVFDEGFVPHVLQSSVSVIKKPEWETETRPTKLDVPAKTETVYPFSISRPASGSNSGSVSGKFINEEELARIPVFERLYREWVGPNDLMAGKFRVTCHDFAVAMVILRHFLSDPNCDGSLPTRRVGELWTGMFSAGDVQRGWNHHRWKVIRDFLSARGHIVWKEHRYEYGEVIEKEIGTQKEKKFQRGIACKWSISAEFDDHLTVISACNIGGASFVDTKKCKLVPCEGKGHNLRPCPFPLRAEMEQLFWMRAYEACEMLCAA